MPAGDQPTQDRVIRVFISSTFRDMQAERDYLVKFIFPQLRKLCESRGVTWGEVDLRWGVTDEQAAEGKVLPICLEEIKRCRPYFIGLLGECYGWIPETLPADLVEREPWLKEHLHGKTSVTELEILHGVLRDPKMAWHAYFYFRDPAYVNSVPETNRNNFAVENAEAATKLRNLKENIRQSGCPVRERYPDPKSLGELVLADFTRVINKLFPEGSQLESINREAMKNEASPRDREGDYLGRQEVNAYAGGDADSSSLASPASGREGRNDSMNSTHRQIRVFISSTFRDMQAERDHLVRFIFPQLRKLCESRGVTWGEVDLRWGVTDEQAAEGKVLPICLEEIKRCRPYFIGLLGERYGWIPETLPADLVEREDWLKEHLYGKTSVTELEILHGVLRNPKMAGHAYFYFRDPKYIETLNEADKKAFTGENAKDAEKLCTLKENIRHSGFPVRENYPDPKALGELVLADLTRGINENWPEGSQPDPLDREAMDHEAYAQSREHVYIGRQEYFDRLGVYASGVAGESSPSPPAAGGEGRGEVGLCVLGESGSGKSALLANWVVRYRQAHPDALVLQHYIGATPYSADWAAMLRRLMGEFKRRLGIQQDIPDQPDALRSAFPNWLYMAAASLGRKGSAGDSPAPLGDSPSGTDARPLSSQDSEPAKRLSIPSGGSPDGTGQWPVLPHSGGEGFNKIIIVLDALNQLEDPDGAPDLVWLPPVLPENVRLIVSTLSGRPLDEIQKRNWPTLKVELLSADDRRKLIAEYLAQHAKSLNAARVERIATAPPSANPLYLRVLLDELRLVRTHEELEERINDYLKAESPYALYEKVIARWEQDYEGDSDLVGDTLSLLWAARRGLTETELLQAMGKDGEPLPRAEWSPLFLAMSDALVSRGGLLTFAHDFLRAAVKNAFLPTELNQQQGHLRLANFFERQPKLFHGSEFAMTPSPRSIDELPWQLAEAEDWNRLSDLLTDRVFFSQAWYHAQFDVKSYWVRIEAASNLRMVTAYSNRIKHGEVDEIYVPRVSFLLADSGHTSGAIHLRSKMVDYFRGCGDMKSLSNSLGNLACALFSRGDLNKAMALHKEEEQICRQSGYLDGLATSLGNQANILFEREDWNGAITLHKEKEQICRQLNNSEGLLITLGNQALILQKRGDFNAAMALHKEEERICRQLNNPLRLQTSLGNQAVILKERGELDSAMALHKEQERICRQIGEVRGLEMALVNQAAIFRATSKLDSAKDLLQRLEQTCRQSGDIDGVQSAIGQQALVSISLGNPEQAVVLLKEQERLCRETGIFTGLEASLGDQANLAHARGDLETALTLSKELEKIYRQTGKSNALSGCLGGQAVILRKQGNLVGALTLHREQALVCRQLGKFEDMAESLACQASLLQQIGQVPEITSLALAEEAYALAVAHGCVELAKRIEAFVSSLRNALLSSMSSPETPAATPREPTLPELRDSAATALKRGHWEAAESYLEKLLQQGEPLETVAPDLITALLNAHETVSTHTVTRIETLLAQLDSAGHTTLAAPLRQQFTAKRGSGKKPWWKFRK